MENSKQNIDPDHVRLTPHINKISCGVDSAASKLLVKSIDINCLVNVGRGWRLVPDKIRQYLDGFLIVNISSDPFTGYEESVAKVLTEYTDNFVVLSGDAKYFQQPTEHICFMPFWYLYQKYKYRPLDHIDQARSYKLSCLNKVSRYHRIENFIKLRKKPYFEKLLFSMLYQYNREYIRSQTPEEFYNLDIIAEFESLIPGVLPTINEDGHSNIHPAYNNSYINLVTETSFFKDTVFLTEKTWKPLVSGQFILWLSNPETVNFLRSIGFDVFDDVLDNHFYDVETNLNKRIDQLHTIIDKVMVADIENIFYNTLDRRQANIDRFYSDSLEDLLTTQCKNTYESNLSIIESTQRRFN